MTYGIVLFTSIIHAIRALICFSVVLSYTSFKWFLSSKVLQRSFVDVCAYILSTLVLLAWTYYLVYCYRKSEYYFVCFYFYALSYVNDVKCDNNTSSKVSAWSNAFVMHFTSCTLNLSLRRVSTPTHSYYFTGALSIYIRTLLPCCQEFWWRCGYCCHLSTKLVSLGYCDVNGPLCI